MSNLREPPGPTNAQVGHLRSGDKHNKVARPHPQRLRPQPLEREYLGMVLEVSGRSSRCPRYSPIRNKRPCDVRRRPGAAERAIVPPSPGPERFS